MIRHIGEQLTGLPHADDRQIMHRPRTDRVEQLPLTVAMILLGVGVPNDHRVKLKPFCQV